MLVCYKTYPFGIRMLENSADHADRRGQGETRGKWEGKEDS
jgi:hypothetical protein